MKTAIYLADINSLSRETNYVVAEADSLISFEDFMKELSVNLLPKMQEYDPDFVLPKRKEYLEADIEELLSTIEYFIMGIPEFSLDIEYASEIIRYSPHSLSDYFFFQIPGKTVFLYWECFG